MNFREQFDSMLAGSAPLLALAPMQEVTDWGFWKLMAGYGGAFSRSLMGGRSPGLRRVSCAGRFRP